MALDTGLYPAQGKLILNPTNYTTGGTDLGLVESGHLVGLDFSMDIWDRMTGGTMSQEAAYTGVNAVYSIRLSEFSSTLLNILLRGMMGAGSGELTFQGFQGYKLGQLLGSSQTFKLQVRPMSDALAAITTKPTVYIPRAAVMSVVPFVWQRDAYHLTGVELKVAALKHSSYSVPILYGDPTTLPAIV